MRVKAERRDFTFADHSSQRRNDKQTAFTFFRTIGNVFSVGRPLWLPILSRPFCNLDRDRRY